MKGKKKFLVMLALLAGISASQVFSIGIGVQAGFPGGALTVKLDSPLSFGVGYYWEGGLDLFADWWIMNPKITSSGSFDLNWFWGVGVGAYGVLSFDYFGIGARVPVGLQAMIADHFEIYLQAVPHLGIRIGDGAGFDWGHIGGNLGFRYHF